MIAGPNDKRKALVVGFDYYGRFLAQLVNEHSTRWELRYCGASRTETVRALVRALSVDAIVCFGGPGPNVALVEIARRRGIPVIVIWAGTDVITARKDPHLLEVIKRYGFTNITDGPWLVGELRELGIDAEYVPVTAIEPAEVIAPLPSEFSVLTYLPEPRREFYGEKTVYEIAREFPDVPFRVVGRGEPNAAAPANVIFLGRIDDMPDRIDASTVLLRLPEHDGKSMLVLETLARGRHVIWNYDFPTVHHAARTHEAIASLRGLKAAHDDGTLQPNADGHRYVSANFRRAQLASSFERTLDRAIASHADRSRRRRVAISGLELFSAQIAAELEGASSDWSAELVRTRGRLEVATSMLTLASSEVWYSIGAPIGDRWLHLLARILRKPRVIHWVGSDISTLASNAALRRVCRNPRVRNLAEVAWTVEELRGLGIDAALAPLPPRLRPREPEPLPEQFTVLFYLPKTRGEFYGRREYERLIRAFPERVRFLAVGGGAFYAPPDAHVQRFGWQTSLEEIYAQTSVLIRFTTHDGLSLMALEALAHARHVLWTQDFPFVTRVSNYSDIEREVRTLLEAHERGELAPQNDAAHFVEREYAPGRCIPRIVEAWESAAAHAPAHTLRTEPT